MSVTCINKNSLEYQSLKNMAGISNFELETAIDRSLRLYNRFPRLDEIRNANSLNYLKELIKPEELTTCSVVKNTNVLNYSKASNIKKAMHKINNVHRDLEVRIEQIDDKDSFISIEQRSNKWFGKTMEDVNPDSTNPSGILNNIIGRLGNYYGIDFIPITNDEIRKMNIPNAEISNAFVYNGNIYINTDVASVDAPLHEMLHIVLGSIRFQDPNLYMQLIQSMDQVKDYNLQASVYKGRTHNDINEEILVSEFSKFVTGQRSLFTDFPKQTINEITYNVTRAIDSALFGNISALTIKPSELMHMSFIDVILALNSSVANSMYNGTLDIEGARTHRIVANTKQDLINNGKLIELCE